MRSLLLTAFFMSSAAVCASASAQGSVADMAAAVALAKTSGCYSCHANAEKVVGPAFSDIAEKYKGDKDAVASLSQTIQNGSRGKWGRIPMPGHPSLSPADVKTLAGWVLTVKP
jgi:cytochrome c